jgi:hypothetical protein
MKNKELMITNFAILVLCIMGAILPISCSNTSEWNNEAIEDSQVLINEFELVSNPYDQKEKKKWIPYEDRKVKGASGTEIHREDGKVRQIFTSVSQETLENKNTRNQLFSDLTTVYKIERGGSIFVFASVRAAKDAYVNDLYNGETWKADYLGRYQVGADHFIKLPHIKEEEVAVQLSTQAQLQLASR